MFIRRIKVTLKRQNNIYPQQSLITKVYKCVQILFVHICTHLYTCICTHLYTFVHYLYIICTHLYTFVHICTHLYIFLHFICTHLYTFVQLTFLIVHICTHLYTSLFEGIPPHFSLFILFNIQSPGTQQLTLVPRDPSANNGPQGPSSLQWSPGTHHPDCDCLSAGVGGGSLGTSVSCWVPGDHCQLLDLWVPV